MDRRSESWADLLRSCKRRGMQAPVLAVGDGALGFWKAVRDVFPQTREQRCWWHRIGNVLAAMPKSALPGAKAALAEIYNAQDRKHAQVAAKAFTIDYGPKWPKAVAKITDELDTLLAFYDYPAEHWIHLRTTNPIESTFATVRLRQRVTKGPGSRAAGVAMAFKLIESVQARWRAVNAPHLVALVRADATFVNGMLVERPDNQQASSKSRDTPIHRSCLAPRGRLLGNPAWRNSCRSLARRDLPGRVTNMGMRARLRHASRQPEGDERAFTVQVTALPNPRSPTSQDSFVRISQPSQSGAAVEALGLPASAPVIVLVGGAKDITAEQLERIRPQLDKGVIPAAVKAGAVFVTGGTHVGVMALLGALTHDHAVLELVGVAPESKVKHITQLPLEAEDSAPQPQGLRRGAGRRAATGQPEACVERLDPNHHKFVLTSGEDWGSETEVLVAIARTLTDGGTSGIVILANGGAIAKYETERFISAGWPVVVLAGSGRAADALANAVDRLRGASGRVRDILGLPAHRHEWAELEQADIEIHSAGSSLEVLARRIAWRLSRQTLLKDAWSRYAAFELAASREQRTTRLVQSFLGIGAFAVTVFSVLLSMHEEAAGLQIVLVILPLLLAVTTSLGEAIVPVRNWLALRVAAESVQREIYAYRAAVITTPQNASTRLASNLEAVDRQVLADGVPLGAIAEVVGRPSSLSAALDEFSSLTLDGYLTERLGGQLQYYRRTAQKLRWREALAFVASAMLAGTVAGLASQQFGSVWLPVFVLAGSTIVIVRQRARWQEKVHSCGSVIAALQAIRTRATLPDNRSNLSTLVTSVESVLERENTEWNATMRKAQL